MAVSIIQEAPGKGKELEGQYVVELGMQPLRGDRKNVDTW